jgi:hypothetical protein
MVLRRLMHLSRKILFICLTLLCFNNAYSQGTRLEPWIHSQSGKWGYIDSSSKKVIIFPHFNLAEAFTNQGFARVTYHNKQSYIDTNGRLLLPFYFNSLSQFQYDTIVLNAEKKHWLISRDSVNYFEYKRGKQQFDYPVNHYYGKKITIKTYKKDGETFNPVELSSQDKSGNWNDNELIFSTVIGNRESISKRIFLPSQIISAQYISYPFAKNYHTGISTEFSFARYWTDTAIMRSSMLSLGIQHRLILSQTVNICVGVQPVINRINSYTLRDKLPSQRILLSNTTQISSIFNANLNLKLADGVFAGAGYKYVPSPIINAVFPRHYIHLFLGFGF